MKTSARSRKKGGQVFVGMMLVIGATIITLGILFVFLSGSLINTSYGVKAEASAQAAAVAGAQDAMLRIARNAYTSPYTLAVGSTTATVTIGSNVPSAGFITVTSTATYLNHLKTIKVVLAVNSLTGLTSQVSWQQVQ